MTTFRTEYSGGTNCFVIFDYFLLLRLHSMQIPWLFPIFIFSLTFNKIPWLLPSLEFPWLFPDRWTPCYWLLHILMPKSHMLLYHCRGHCIACLYCKFYDIIFPSMVFSWVCCIWATLCPKSFWVWGRWTREGITWQCLLSLAKLMARMVW